ncbi:hypothetical protein GCM10010207_50940 [Streptomyces atratus]|nr:hypothetical protein GCM10010207_50940 [Streptomyces atratus]
MWSRRAFQACTIRLATDEDPYLWLEVNEGETALDHHLNHTGAAAVERRGRGLFFPMLSMMDILPGAEPLISGVRQSGSSPVAAPADIRPRRVGVETTGDEIGPRGGPWIGDCGQVPSSAMPALRSGSPNQPDDSATAAVGALLACLCRPGAAGWLDRLADGGSVSDIAVQVNSVFQGPAATGLLLR